MSSHTKRVLSKVFASTLKEFDAMDADDITGLGLDRTGEYDRNSVQARLRVVARSGKRIRYYLEPDP